MRRRVTSVLVVVGALTFSTGSTGVAWAQFMEEVPPPKPSPPRPSPTPQQPWVAPPPPPSSLPPAPPSAPAKRTPPPPPAAAPAPPVTISPPPTPVLRPPAAPAPRSFARTPLDEDGLTAVAEPPPPRHPAPFMKIGYRRLGLKNLDTTADDFSVNAFELDLYPVSRDYLRVGSELVIGAASGILDGHSTTNWYTTSGWSLGFQYPWRVTPFVDFRFAAGLLGGEVAGKTAITWTWQVGLEGGIELYIVDRTFVSVGFGWVRPTYRGFDLAKSKLFPTQDPDYQDFPTDTWTLRVSLGL